MASYYDSVVLADSPVAFWPLDETSGTVAADATGNGNTGTYTGGYTLGQTGIGDGEASVTLNGSTGYISVPNSAGLEIGGTAITLECWINLSSRSGVPALLRKSTASDNYGLYLNGTGAALQIDINGTNLGANGSVSTSVWAYLVGTYNGTNVIYYLDGSAIGSPSFTASIATSTDSLYIGNNSNVYFMAGAIAKVAVYNYALTPTQIAKHYAAATYVPPRPVAPFWQTQPLVPIFPTVPAG